MFSTDISPCPSAAESMFTIGDTAGHGSVSDQTCVLTTRPPKLLLLDPSKGGVRRAVESIETADVAVASVAAVEVKEVVVTVGSIDDTDTAFLPAVPWDLERAENVGRFIGGVDQLNPILNAAIGRSLTGMGQADEPSSTSALPLDPKTSLLKKRRKMDLVGDEWAAGLSLSAPSEGG